MIPPPRLRVPVHPPLLGGRVARCRRWWWLYVRRYRGELCQDCGGRYDDTIWHAPDSLWGIVTGQQWELNLAGQWIYRDGDQIVTEERAKVISLLCPRCFSRRADNRSIMLVWTPTEPREARRGNALR